MTRPVSSPGRDLGHGALAAALLTAVDGIVARANRTSVDVDFELRALAAAATWFVLVCAIGVVSSRVLERALRLRGSALRNALLLGALGAHLDLVYLRWPRVNASPWTAVESLAIGAAVASAAYLVIARCTSAAGATAGQSGSRRSGGSRALAVAAGISGLALAASIAAPSLRAPSEQAVRPTVDGHAIQRILLIVVDTLRADALSHASPEAPSTPGPRRARRGECALRGGPDAGPVDAPRRGVADDGRVPLGPPRRCP